MVFQRTLLAALALTIVGGFLLAASPAVARFVPAAISRAATAAPSSAECEKTRFFLLKPWYEYLPVKDDGNGGCKVDLKLQKTNSWTRLWLIGLVILEDLLRIAGMVAGIFVIVGGVKFIMSRGEPDNTKDAINTIINAMIGLAIAIIASAAVAFIANRLKY